MRISDDRYDRDRLRLDVAMRFIRHEARTRTIRLWTGLSDDRIRRLYHAYLQEGGRTTRHRGQSPQQATYFLRTTRMRGEASALASLCSLVGLFDRQIQMPRQLNDVGRGDSLCRAYDVYLAEVRCPAITFDYAALLVNALERGSVLRLGDCQGCGALLVIDSLGLRPSCCSLCSTRTPGRGHPGSPFTLPKCHSSNARPR
jgi:hypothetical protein